MAITLPARFVDDRIFVRAVTTDGVELTLYADTGGGLWITDAAASRLGLQPFQRSVHGQVEDCVHPLAFGDDTPPPKGVYWNVFKASENLVGEGDGMLGMVWFADRVWRLDYPRRKLLLLDDFAVPPGMAQHCCPLGFARRADGQRGASFPRIQAEIDGAVIDLLFDTGAQVGLAPEAAAARPLTGGGRVRGTSFIVATHFDAWHVRHPEWPVIPHAEARSGEPMMRVPAVRVAGYEVGPVWFTRRADHNFHEFMSQWMDRRIDGALGGSLLKYFCVTMDYPNAVAYFQR